MARATSAGGRISTGACTRALAPCEAGTARLPGAAPDGVAPGSHGYFMYLRTSSGVRLTPYFGADTWRKRLGEYFGLHCFIESWVFQTTKLPGMKWGTFLPWSSETACLNATASAHMAVLTWTPSRPLSWYCLTWHAKPFSSVPDTGTKSRCAAWNARTTPCCMPPSVKTPSIFGYCDRRSAITFCAVESAQSPGVSLSTLMFGY